MESPGAGVGAGAAVPTAAPSKEDLLCCAHSCKDRREVVCCEQPGLQQLQEGSGSRAVLGPCAP